MTKPETIDISREEACIIFREKLTSAIKQRLPENNASIASELSGGLDSTTITAIASQLGTKIYAFTHAAEHGNDERFLVNDFLKMYPDIKHMLITKKNINLADDCCWVTKTLAQLPCSGVSEWARQLMESAGNTGSKIIFSGFGGDEGVSQRASGCAYNELIENHQWGYLYREAKNHRKYLWPYTLAHLVFNYYFKSKPVIYDNSVNKNFLKKEFRLSRQAQSSGLPRKSTFEYTKYLLPNRKHTALRLEESYQLGSEFGLKYRYPLLDIKLLEFFNSLPAYCKIHLNKNRFLFRNESMADLTPKTIRNNYDKTIGGSIVPGLDEVWNTIENELNKTFDLNFVDQDYLNKAKVNRELEVPIYQLVSCKSFYQNKFN
jgi:asparagine synthase (glutamine-hydrolysing)